MTVTENMKSICDMDIRSPVLEILFKLFFHRLWISIGFFYILEFQENILLVDLNSSDQNMRGSGVTLVLFIS